MTLAMFELFQARISMPSSEGNVSIYKPNASCQIPNIGELYTKLFGEDVNRTFVEVGAYDGESFSNTSFLADIGWKGIYIEPTLEYAQACLNRHVNNNVSVIRCAVGSEEKIVEIYQGGTLTTPLKSQVEMYDQVDWAKGHHHGKSFSVKQRRLDTLLKKCEIQPLFDLLVVDVEGYEPEVFNSFDLGFWKPKVMIVEIEDKHPSFTEYQNFTTAAAHLRQKIKNAGYREEYVDHINTVFVLEEV